MTPEEYRQWFPQPPATAAEYLRDRYNYWIRFRLWNWWDSREYRKQERVLDRQKFWQDVAEILLPHFDD